MGFDVMPNSEEANKAWCGDMYAAQSGMAALAAGHV
jgi:hypothetical protein